MPTADQILEQLTRLARDGRGVAFFWHLVAIVGFAALGVTGRWPRPSIAAAISTGPIATAAALAIFSANPFNSVVLGVATVALLLMASRLHGTRLDPGPLWTVIAGSGAVAYALAYPHFIDVRSWVDLWFAPAGVVPCPSLALALGFSLLGGGFGSRAWSFTAAAVGAFYALFGLLRLGVWLDVGLLVAAGALAVQGFALTRGSPGSIRYAA